MCARTAQCAVPTTGRAVTVKQKRTKVLHKILQKHSQYAGQMCNVEEKKAKAQKRRGREIAFGTGDALKTKRKLQTLIKVQGCMLYIAGKVLVHTAQVASALPFKF